MEVSLVALKCPTVYSVIYVSHDTCENEKIMLSYDFLLNVFKCLVQYILIIAKINAWFGDLG